jgi:hypothetical protein
MSSPTKFSIATIEEEFRTQKKEVRMQSMGDSDPPLIEDHQIDHFGVVFHIHPPVSQNSILNSDD